MCLALEGKARRWVPGGVMPAAEHFVLSGVERAAVAQAPWLLVTAASLGLHLLLFQSRCNQCVSLRTKSFLSSGQGCFWLSRGGNKGSVLFMCVEADVGWQMLCRRRALDGA